MVYIALLRGINVGGRNKVEMSRLRATFEAVGCSRVKSYINSGNVIFEDARLPADLQTRLVKKLQDDFGFDIKLLLVTRSNLQTICSAVPDNWQNNATMKCDVMFLWHHENSQSVLDKLPIKPEIDNIKYVDGAIVWCIDRQFAARSGMLKLIGSELYKNMTIRNCNTVRKLEAMASQYN